MKTWWSLAMGLSVLVTLLVLLKTLDPSREAFNLAFDSVALVMGAYVVVFRRSLAERQARFSDSFWGKVKPYPRQEWLHAFVGLGFIAFGLFGLTSKLVS